MNMGGGAFHLHTSGDVTTGGMGRAGITFYKRLASILREKKDAPYICILRL